MATDRTFWMRTPLNAVVNIIRTLVTALIGVILVPFYIDNLGLAAYGIIPLATTMTSYVMIIADSLESACSRYSTLSIHGGEDASRELSTGFYGIAKVCIALVPLMAVIAYVSPYVFGVGGTSASDVQIMFMLILLSSLIVTLSATLSSVFNAFNSLYRLYIARLLYSVVQVALIFLFFGIGMRSLVEVGIAYLISSVFLLVSTYLLAKRTYPAMRIRRCGYDRTLFGTMGKLGGWSVAYKIGNMLYIQASLVVINLYLGSEAGGGFAIVSSLVSMIHTACYSVTTSFEPLIYRFYSQKDDSNLHHLLTTGLKFVAILFAMPIAFVIVFAPQIIEAWVGAEYIYLAQVIRIALLGDVAYCAATVLQSVPTVYLKMDLFAEFTIALGVANTIAAAFVALYTDLGMEGVTEVWLVCTLMYTLLSVIFVGRITGAGAARCLKPIAVGYVSMAACCAVFFGISELFTLPGRWIPIFVLFFVLLAVYVPLMFLTLDSYEKEKISSFLPGFMKKVLGRFFSP